MKIALIGSGNIATFFAARFHEHGHAITQVISANLLHARHLADVYRTDYSNQLDHLTGDADVVILAVKDDILPMILQHPALRGRTLIHTAGSVKLDLLLPVTSHAGSIWCVYSVNKHHLPARTDIPLIINASDEFTLEIIAKLASCISNQQYHLDDEQKRIAHLSAVFANNFTNYIFTIAQDILQKHNLPFDLLMPLIENTVEKLQYNSPDKLQTGPAMRHDTKTLEQHQRLLEEEPSYLEVYKLLSNLIQAKHPSP